MAEIISHFGTSVELGVRRLNLGEQGVVVNVLSAESQNQLKAVRGAIVGIPSYSGREFVSTKERFKHRLKPTFVGGPIYYKRPNGVIDVDVVFGVSVDWQIDGLTFAALGHA
jgi:hypothetical protein